MPENNAATPLPAPDAGTNSTPTLAVVPDPPPASPTSYGLTLRQLRELSLAQALATHAGRVEYAAALGERGINAGFLQTLQQDIGRLVERGQAAHGSDVSRKGATVSESASERTLLKSLRHIQSAARLQHLPDNAHLLENYYVGQRFDKSRPELESVSQLIIGKADQERPGGLDTSFISRAQGERTAYMGTNTAQTAEQGKARLARTQRDELVKSIVARRKKIQYAADVLWPARQPESAQARSDFQLPANRPYSY
jgi:hypothetical protein